MSNLLYWPSINQLGFDGSLNTIYSFIHQFVIIWCALFTVLFECRQCILVVCQYTFNTIWNVILCSNVLPYFCYILEYFKTNTDQSKTCSMPSPRISCSLLLWSLMLYNLRYQKENHCQRASMVDISLWNS